MALRDFVALYLRDIYVFLACEAFAILLLIIENRSFLTPSADRIVSLASISGLMHGMYLATFLINAILRLF